MEHQFPVGTYPFLEKKQVGFANRAASERVQAFSRCLEPQIFLQLQAFLLS